MVHRILFFKPQHHVTGQMSSHENSV